MSNSPYKQVETATRPFRIWNAVTKKHMPGCCYKHLRNAHDGAMRIVRWGKIDTKVELHDVTKGKLIAQYVRKPTGLWWK